MNPKRMFGNWLLDYLSDGAEHYANEVYMAYKRAYREAWEQQYDDANTPIRQRHVHKPMNRNSFIGYLWKLRQLGWVAYVPDPKQPDGRKREPSLAPSGEPRLPFTITAEGSGADWTNINRSFDSWLHPED